MDESSVERYRNGLRAGEPRLLLQATRPLLSLLGAVSIAQGKLAGETRPSPESFPALNSHPDLRKLSIQRLLLGHERHAWSAGRTRSQWRQAGGLDKQAAGECRHPFMARSSPAAGTSRCSIIKPAPFDGSPDDDLLAWVLAESNATALAPLCSANNCSAAVATGTSGALADRRAWRRTRRRAGSFAARLRPPRPVVARCTRQAPAARRIPSVVHRDADRLVGQPQSWQVPGLAEGQRAALRFHPPRWQDPTGSPSSVSHGSSLYVDFDRRLVVALYATYPQ
jgi:hypothetical protein